ncbi:S-layer homology domain-containing protein [Metabacillus iocasae]|uniref:SLH domain-containing protein n=1 Tax=Priestia iocasae TaxID=2291674 RepID=A0ABS2QXX8_9BACI|nr:S-layer homology domain-containing protein [Metabacillus iocasae]MBM7703837.1 hypothetical protein [Metabacillus iocasae]
MKKKRLLTALLLSCTLALSVTSVHAADKTVDSYLAYDIVDHSAYEEMDDFLAADIIDGMVDEDGAVAVKPNQSITRAQFTKILVNALGLTVAPNTKTFSDVKKLDWHYEYITIASSLGIVTGRPDGKFYPYEQIKREHMAVMIHRAFKKSVTFKNTNKPFKDVPSSHWAYQEIHESSSVGIINGYTATNEFRPLKNATRAQAVLMIHRALKQETKNLPNAQAITSLVKQQIDKENQLVKVNDFSGLTALYNQHTTGFYKVAGLDSLEMLQFFVNDLGAKFSVEPIGTYSISVKHLNDRYVQVETKDMKQKVNVEIETSKVEEVLDVSGIYSLKKEASGAWKIYNFVPNDESLAGYPLFGF